MSRSPSSTGRREHDLLMKSLLAAKALRDVTNGTSQADAETSLRCEVGPHWSLMTAAQYLTGRRAIAALSTLPEDFSYSGLTKAELIGGLAIAHFVCANFHPGSPLSAGVFVERFKIDN